MLWWSLAFAAPTYNNDDVTLDVRDARRSELVAALRKPLTDLHVQVEPKLSALSRPELLGVLVATSTTERGSELDLRLDGHRVTVWEDGPAWKVASTPDDSRPPLGPTIDELAAHYGLYATRAEGGAQWDPRTTGALRDALQHLTPAERAQLADITWVRRPRPPHPPSHTDLHAASFIVDDSGARIEIYDETLTSSMRFVGPLDDPSSPAVAVLLHEIAHAIADAPLRTLGREYERRRKAHDAARAQHTQEVHALNRQIDTYNRAPTPALRAAIESEAARLKQANDDLEALARQLQSAHAALEKDATVSPMAAAYQMAVGIAPTAYGRVSPDEAFAEAFALHELDPAALERISPEAARWFAADQHMAEL